MNVFKTCFSPKRSDIYLPEDEEEDENVNKMCCCFNFKGNNKQGFIQLPTNNNNSRRRTIDDYLDPRSPVSIEVLLQEQEEELDHYYGQTDDEDAYHGPQKKFGPLDLNFENTNSSFFEEEDAQFLSEHRISAILVDRPKLSSAHIFKEDNNIMEQELFDVVVPTKSTSTGSISSRRFAFKKFQPEEEEGEAKETENNTQIASSPQELTSITNKFNKTYTSSVSSLSASSSTSTILSITNTSAQPMEQQIVNEKAEEKSKSVSPVNAAGLPDSSFNNYKIPTATFQNQQPKQGEFPATTLTRVPYQPLPPLQISPPSFSPSSSHSHTIIKPQTSSSSSSSSIQHTGRRPSLVTTAQSILGDKLDDFTEKLAFIKKNIIMSIDNDEEEDGSSSNHYYNTDRKSQEIYRNRAGSIGKSNEYNRVSRISTGSSTSLLVPSPPLPPPPPPPRTSSIANNNIGKRIVNDYDQDEEEIFDFSKVVAISKNVRTFGEGMMGNGLRMFNNLSTRIKNAQQQQQQQQQQQVELNNNNNNNALHVRF